METPSGQNIIFEQSGTAVLVLHTSNVACWSTKVESSIKPPADWTAIPPAVLPPDEKLHRETVSSTSWPQKIAKASEPKPSLGGASLPMTNEESSIDKGPPDARIADSDGLRLSYVRPLTEHVGVVSSVLSDLTYSRSAAPTRTKRANETERTPEERARKIHTYTHKHDTETHKRYGSEQR